MHTLYTHVTQLSSHTCPHNNIRRTCIIRTSVYHASEYIHETHSRMRNNIVNRLYPYVFVRIITLRIFNFPIQQQQPTPLFYDYTQTHLLASFFLTQQQQELLLSCDIISYSSTAVTASLQHVCCILLCCFHIHLYRDRPAVCIFCRLSYDEQEEAARVKARLPAACFRFSVSLGLSLQQHEHVSYIYMCVHTFVQIISTKNEHQQP